MKLLAWESLVNNFRINQYKIKNLQVTMGKLSPKHNGSQRLLDVFYIPVTVKHCVFSATIFFEHT